MSAERRREAPTKRTFLASGAAIAVAIGAGAFALAANLGWLSSSAGARVGTLSAAQDLVSATISSDRPADDPAGTSAGAQSFVVGDAGRVVVTSAGGNLLLASVHAAHGWTWRVLPNPASQLDVSFTNGSRTLLLRVATGPDGSIASVVREGSGGTAPTTPGNHRTDAHAEREGHGEDD